ncbi:MAG TPA: hypothetical protein VGM81_03215 [Burkholderiaceae bacterium]|jgi:hypothetical protein
MSDDEFQQFIDSCVAELQAKQEGLPTYGIGSFERWDFNQHDGKLRFTSAAGTTGVVAEVLIIGTYSLKAESWKWAWANDSMLTEIRTKATVFKELAAVTGLDFFEDADPLEIDPATAWETVAMCVKHVGALGAYRGPSSDGRLVTMFAITRIAPMLSA